MFKNRQQAGSLLAKKIKKELGEEESKKANQTMVILGIPRGGMVVAQQVAESLNSLLDVLVVKKIGAPGNQELAIGAIGETNGSKYIDWRLAKEVGAGQKYLEQQISFLRKEIKRRESVFREGRPPLDLKNKIVILVDDGAATGATLIAGCREIWNNQPQKVVIGVPVVAKDTLEKLKKEADEVIFLEAPEIFFSVGQFYQDFPQVSDREVLEILNSTVQK